MCICVLFEDKPVGRVGDLPQGRFSPRPDVALRRCYRGSASIAALRLLVLGVGVVRQLFGVLVDLPGEIGLVDQAPLVTGRAPSSGRPPELARSSRDADQTESRLRGACRKRSGPVAGRGPDANHSLIAC